MKAPGKDAESLTDRLRIRIDRYSQDDVVVHTAPIQIPKARAESFNDANARSSK
jgi:hypothetical protein